MDGMDGRREDRRPTDGRREDRQQEDGRRTTGGQMTGGRTMGGGQQEEDGGQREDTWTKLSLWK